jgi:hypothetical protein
VNQPCTSKSFRNFGCDFIALTDHQSVQQSQALTLRKAVKPRLDPNLGLTDCLAPRKPTVGLLSPERGWIFAAENRRNPLRLQVGAIIKRARIPARVSKPQETTQQKPLTDLDLVKTIREDQHQTVCGYPSAFRPRLLRRQGKLPTFAAMLRQIPNRAKEQNLIGRIGEKTDLIRCRFFGEMGAEHARSQTGGEQKYANTSNVSLMANLKPLTAGSIFSNGGFAGSRLLPIAKDRACRKEAEADRQDFPWKAEHSLHPDAEAESDSNK